MLEKRDDNGPVGPYAFSVFESFAYCDFIDRHHYLDFQPIPLIDSLYYQGGKCKPSENLRWSQRGRMYLTIAFEEAVGLPVF